jgi:uncharacterized membrane protein
VVLTRRVVVGSMPRNDLGTRKVVMMSVGDTGMRTLGLVTRDHFKDLPSGLGGDGVVAVYVPFSYQVGGFTVFVPCDRLTVLDMSLEDAMHFIVTAGATR